MTEQSFTAPALNPEVTPFYAAAAQGRFLCRRCTDCRRAHWYPRAQCPFCFGNTDWEQASGDGVIYSYSVLRRVERPYTIAYVTLAEGPTMMTNIVDCDLGALRIGLPVHVVFKATQDGPPVPCFTPA